VLGERERGREGESLKVCSLVSVLPPKSQSIRMGLGQVSTAQYKQIYFGGRAGLGEETSGSLLHGPLIFNVTVYIYYNIVNGLYKQLRFSRFYFL
jgi:hypothetical protein